MTATSFPRAGRTNRTSAAAYDRSPALYWTYEDIGTFLFVVVLINDLIRLAVRLHFLNSSDLIVPRLAIQALIIIFLGLALYAILKFRYHRPVIAPLGWLIPSKFYVAISILGGVIGALAITYFTHLQGQVTPSIPAKDFFVLGFLLGPMLEESVFRGYLLPVLAHTLGYLMSVLATSVLFAAFHSPGDITHWLWFTATGSAYGWLRLASRTTTAAAILHVTCNLTLFFALRIS
jgi:membrane protease YdiL (CAAX protease family)